MKGLNTGCITVESKYDMVMIKTDQATIFLDAKSASQLVDEINRTVDDIKDGKQADKLPWWRRLFG
jgi:hypothetical protein